MARRTRDFLLGRFSSSSRSIPTTSSSSDHPSLASTMSLPAAAASTSTTSSPSVTPAALATTSDTNISRSMAATSIREDSLSGALEDDDLCEEFRLYLRTKLDSNKSPDPFVKKKFEVQLDFLIICKQIFCSAEEDEDLRIKLMIDVGERFLGKPPEGYNIALSGQHNRAELVRHCKNLKDRVTSEADTQLLRPGYDFIFGTLTKKYDLFKKSRPTTTLQAILCAIT